jgi:hypothetical protein
MGATPVARSPYRRIGGDGELMTGVSDLISTLILGLGFHDWEKGEISSIYGFGLVEAQRDFGFCQTICDPLPLIA